MYAIVAIAVSDVTDNELKTYRNQLPLSKRKLVQVTIRIWRHVSGTVVVQGHNQTRGRFAPSPSSVMRVRRRKRMLKEVSLIDVVMQ